MLRFRVKFRGLLNKSEHERLAAAHITLESSERPELAGIAGAGRPVYTVILEADCAANALTRVRNALDPDTGNFSDWESSPA